jgi:hypothetical protein
MEQYKEICGALHLHTKFSDGGVDYPAMIKTAQILGLDFIITTDHMTLQGLQSGYEGFHDKLAVLCGYEHNDYNNLNHYLVMGVSRVFTDATEPQMYIDAVKENGGIGFLAHPAEKRKYMAAFPAYPWTTWDIDRFDGIEIWNQFSDWVEQLRTWKSVIRLCFPRRFIKRAPEDLLKKWDELNVSRYVSGIGGVDAHTKTYRKGIFTFRVFPIKVELKGIRTHLYIKDIKQDNTFGNHKRSILNSLKNGHSFISNFRRGDASGSTFSLITKSGTEYPPGNFKYDATPAAIKVSIPKVAEIRLILNNKTIETVNAADITFAIKSAGVYRVEVYKKDAVWMYSNPFRVFGL